LGGNENAIKITDILCVNCKFVAYSRSGASKTLLAFPNPEFLQNTFIQLVVINFKNNQILKYNI